MFAVIVAVVLAAVVFYVELVLSLTDVVCLRCHADAIVALPLLL